MRDIKSNPIIRAFVSVGSELFMFFNARHKEQHELYSA